jgi:colanic acid/amylovoran biosynthesis glycosyltransferase
MSPFPFRGVTLSAADSLAPQQPPVVMAVGRLIPKKGFQTLVKAMGILRQQYPQGVECHIIGDGPEQETLSALISQLELTEAVKLLGAKSNLEIREILPQATMFVLPRQIDPNAADRDGIPVALMEAMASSVCVITGRLEPIDEPIDELVRDGETGLLIEPGNEQQLASAMQSLLSDDQRRTELARQGREWEQQEFSEHTNIDRLLAAFQ